KFLETAKLSQRSDLLKRRRNRPAARRQISEEEENEKKERAVLNVPTNYSSTLGNSFIDLAFTRNITTELLNCIYYFLYYRPILHKIVTN
ncbi:hypothetical protein AVEN_224898-1, partial [Araneus ventricosus]